MIDYEEENIKHERKNSGVKCQDKKNSVPFS
jgi:hypothetical protein